MVQGDFSDLSFVNKQQGWIMIRTESGLGYSKVNIYKTQSGGKDWDLLYEMGQETTDGISLSGNKTGIFFKSDLIGWMTGLTTADLAPWLFKTIDGGKTWIKYNLSLPYQNYSFLLTDEPVFVNNKGIIVVHGKRMDKKILYFMDRSIPINGNLYLFFKLNS
jgi:photosystem II stability/assembly factor-like uncharacterized protein